MKRNPIAARFRGATAGLSLDTAALARYPDLIDLSIGDTDFTTDRRIIDAAYRDACAGATHYGYPQGDPELIAAIRKAWREDFGQEVAADNVCVTASSCMGMALAMLAILDPGDEVIVLAPYFAVYRQQIETAGGVCVEVPCAEEDGWAIREEALERAITPRTRAVIFNNPVNPTGAAYGPDTLRLLARVAQRHDLLVAADEIYTRYLYEGTFTPLRTLPGMAERTITLNSFSKNFMMTGWRLGYIIAAPEIVSAVQFINGGMVYTAPSVSQRAAIEALAIREDVARLYITQYRERVFRMADALAQVPYMTLRRPQGTFYLFPGIKATGLTAREFCRRALERAQVLLTPGDAFGAAGAGHVRIACTSSLDRLLDAAERLKEL